LFLYFTSVFEKVLKKPNSFCRVTGRIKILFEEIFVKNKMFLWSQNIQLVLDIFSNSWKGWWSWRIWLLKVCIDRFWYICSIVCILEIRRRDIGCRFSWKVFVIRDIDNRRDLVCVCVIYISLGQFFIPKTDLAQQSSPARLSLSLTNSLVFA
jgi:hypothetical protein